MPLAGRRGRVGLALLLVVSGLGCTRRSTLPQSLGNREFWSLIEALSEPPGTFSLSENLVSNEPLFAENIRWLGPAGGLYVGVGPEQNFSYVARLRPSIAFIVDIRQENRNLHLLYKALFELSTDRAGFVSLLFSRPPPEGLDPGASAREILDRYDRVAPSASQRRATSALVRDRLCTTRGLPLSPADLDNIDRILETFAADGPAIQFWGARTVHADAVRPSYRELMTAKDSAGRDRSFLASDAAFGFVKDLHTRNLIVPVVGDFGGSTTLRRLGDWARREGGVVTAFYGSNVGVYLTSEQARAFCGNLSALPAAPRARFIESNGVMPFASRLAACAAGSGSTGR